MKAIVVIDEKWNIGKEGSLLAHLPKDLLRFKKLTEGEFIIMGRKTLESFPGGRPLPNRTNIILTRDKSYTVPGALIVNSFEELFDLKEILSQIAPEKDFIVCGGGEIYKSLLDRISEVAITKIHTDFEECDTVFPNLDEKDEWKQEIIGSEEDGEFTTSFLFYTKK